MKLGAGIASAVFRVDQFRGEGTRRAARFGLIGSEVPLALPESRFVISGDPHPAATDTINTKTGSVFRLAAAQRDTPRTDFDNPSSAHVHQFGAFAVIDGVSRAWDKPEQITDFVYGA